MSKDSRVPLPVMKTPRALSSFLLSANLLAWVFAAGFNAAAADLAGHYEAFQSPSPEYRPFVRWWWNGARVTEAEALRQLDVLQAAGIGGVEINTIAMPLSADPATFDLAPALTWLSPEWCSVVASVARGADERGMTADVIVGSGWPFGGRFLEVDEQIQRVRIVKVPIEGPIEFEMTLAEIAAFGSSRDDHEKSNEMEPSRRELVSVFLHPSDLSPLAPFDVHASLLENVDESGLKLFVPEGPHTLYCSLVETGYTQVKLGAPGADGPIINHYDAAAVRKYLDNMSSQISQHVGTSMGELFRATFVDSLELAHSNWTHDFVAEFEQRRGYNPLGVLPFILDPAFSTEDTQFLAVVERARYDFSLTLIELFDERFMDTYVAWAEDNGLKARIQAYGRETHPLHGSLKPHLPEGETWLWHDDSDSPGIRVESTTANKYVTSAAHIAGKRLISYEAMTNAVPVFRETLEDFKLGLDLSILDGLNHPIIHGFNYTPMEAGFPGWVRFGCYLNERTPFWPYMPAFSDFAARIGYMMRHAKPQVQVAVLAPRPEEWEEHGLLYQPFPEVRYPWYQYALPRALQKVGFGVNYISDELLAQSDVVAGQLIVGEAQFELVVLESVDAMSPEAARRLRSFADAGGKIAFLGELPNRSSGHQDALLHDALVRSAMNGIISDSVIRLPSPTKPMDYPDPRDRGAWIDDRRLVQTASLIARRLEVERPVTIEYPSTWLSQVHYRTDDGTDFVYFSNTNRRESVATRVNFRGMSGEPVIWDLATADRHLPAKSSDTHLDLELGPLESVLVVFEGVSALPEPTDPPSRPDLRQETPLEVTWSVTFHPAGDGESFERVMRNLSDLSRSDDADVAGFGGRIVYRSELDFERTPSQAALDFGFINGTSSLRINGVDQGISWYGRHQYDVSGALRKGSNLVELEVTTQLGNFFHAQKDNETAQRFAHWYNKPIAMGITEQVVLKTPE